MITVNRKIFLAEMAWLKTFIEKKSTIPILMFVSIEADGSCIRLRATDLETSATSMGSCTGSGEISTVFFPPRVVDYLKSCEADEVGIEVIDEAAMAVEQTEEDGKTKVITPMQPGVIRFTCDGGEVDAETLPIEMYPELPAVPDPACILAFNDETIATIRRAMISISGEESRFTLNGALLDLNGCSRLISTDGHRLSILRLPTPLPAVTPHKAILSREFLKRFEKLYEGMKKNTGPVILGIGDQFTSFLTRNRIVVSRRLTGNFPDYERVVPKDYRSLERTAEIEPENFATAISKGSTCADERSRCVTLSLSPSRVTIEASGNGGRSKGIAAAKITGPEMNHVGSEIPAPYVIGLNADYISEFARNSDKPITAYFQSPKDSAVFESGDWLYLVMPMRL